MSAVYVAVVITGVFLAAIVRHKYLELKFFEASRSQGPRLRAKLETSFTLIAALGVAVAVSLLAVAVSLRQ